ncbi:MULTISPECIES: tRNA (N6-isopentenyl adenosine(37)-C2)-methylthiotransferase MiaB [Thermodesulfobacterium]|jgi:tRNA-2-methylthio-N6-dimethylallyladenosine synthase|uniref:tRNA-2-methylthio-N(6)-dimethylallyladenosine synthase n=2 Tax=Thermodesulfobacterium commune TaxID=1741 RepID=A0A075WTE0_9BACT|nr:MULTISPECIES: tRNA (N6-isopentenyl adenosine(37)-C2)-methylthiotransferase MiaB [Thermodesulfobacterium]KUJ97931.1 MAG: (Dimethylallyl)adenosine tRNA methylthiotransferase MiaB [Thermodesulfobacterium sp. 37_54]KUK19515.1 MAG: (Dimethylallyl)adenosine tRNA methylthiotransferase MiaB [Thermodesulfobacterium commune]AIH04111.1 dimethylallyladenosine tRNA methylthiotransferase [Thermodesulfobacterium commune DSM 2178]KUK37927.1 MAG: (Dimethylallyl)adenosine tRNA methylthiotransferase MiaB [Ther
MKKRVYIKTFGCQMNENDSEKVLILLKEEYVPTDNPEEADLIIVNTCSVREKPQHKVYSEVGRYKPLKKKKKHLLIGIIGCVAQQEGENLIKKLPYVDFVLGTQSFYQIKEVITKLQKDPKPIVLTELTNEFKPPLVLPEETLSKNTEKVTAFVTIMQGCDNFCSYCIVPYVRGRETSRPPEEIIEEIKRLVELGVREVTLLGQNVNSYGLKEKGYPDFPELLNQIAAIEDLWRIRFTTSHPKDLSEKLIRTMAENPKICHHIHLPLQAGSNRILKRMNRKYTKEEYLEKVAKLRELIPDIAITTDIIVGFPGETEEDFEETLEMLKTVRYHEIFSFKYSDRPFTTAKNFEDKIPEEEKEIRLKLVQELQKTITQEIYQQYVGKEMEVLVEGFSSKSKTQLMGRTSTNVIVNFYSPRLDLKGRLVKVRIEEAGKHSLKGRYLEILK